MAGCLDSFRLPDCLCVPNSLINLTVGEKRNQLASIAAGLLFSLAWWLAIDAFVVYPDKPELCFYIIAGIVATVSFFMVNAFSHRDLGGSQEGICRLIWFYVAYLAQFLALFGGCGILIVECLRHDGTSRSSVYPGWAMFLQNTFIFAASLLFKFGRSEELYDDSAAF